LPQELHTSRNIGEGRRLKKEEQREKRGTKEIKKESENKREKET
jgi:hypothetical protein